MKSRNVDNAKWGLTEWRDLLNVGWLTKLERADFVEWEEAHGDWADDATVRNRAETVARVPRVGTFAVVSGDEELAIWDGGINLARGVFFRAVSG